MPPTVSLVGDDWYVAGVALGIDPVRLGRTRFQVGAHLIGIDDRYSRSGVINTYWDVANDAAACRLNPRSIRYYGYVQLMEVLVAGRPVPPRIYGGQLNNRVPYLHRSGTETQVVLDLMGPDQALARNIPDRISTPFYALNGALLAPISDLDQLANFPQPNGSLRIGDLDPDVIPPVGLALYPSLCADLTPEMLTAADITRWLAGTGSSEDPTSEPEPVEPLHRLAVTAEELGNHEAYALALAWLRKNSPYDGDKPYLVDILDSSIVARVIGSYVLLTVPQVEDLGPTLVVTTIDPVSKAPVPGPTPTVLIYELSEYDMDELTAGNTRDLLRRLTDYAVDEGWTGSMMEQAEDRYGFASTDDLINLPPDRPVLELKYWTLGCATYLRQTRTSRVCLSGFTWSVLFEFDSVLGTFEAMSVRRPQAVDSYSLQQVVSAYDDAITAARPSMRDAPLDISNFTVASLRRRTFAGGGLYSMVDISGAEVEMTDGSEA